MELYLLTQLENNCITKLQIHISSKEDKQKCQSTFKVVPPTHEISLSPKSENWL